MNALNGISTKKAHAAGETQHGLDLIERANDTFLEDANQQDSTDGFWGEMDDACSVAELAEADGDTDEADNLKASEVENSSPTEASYTPEQLERLRSIGIVTLGELEAKNPEPLPLVVEGLLEAGQIASFVGATKSGKTMALLDLATVMHNGGGLWLGRQVVGGRVLYIDNELQERKIVERLGAVNKARGSRSGSASFQVWTLRGEYLTIKEIADLVASTFKPGDFQLIILDSLYVAMPDGSESDDGLMKRVARAAGQITTATGAAMILSHHSTKGNQATRSVADVGSGSGVLQRYINAHCVLREHSQKGMAVFEAKLRDFDEDDGNAETWEFKYPLWRLRPDIDPTLKAGTTQGDVRRKENLSESARRVLEAVRKYPNRKVSDYRTLAAKDGCATMGKETVERALKVLIDRGDVVHDKHTDTYAPSGTTPKAELPF
jgi:hypothetical protein